ncbi:N-acetyltransferase [Mycobacteroides abscessus subsp. bolletii]|uniref:N-acetyltransferase n=1 Tax=Mycobacteroides abscessus TaxID=36809 RepID=UPI000D88467A|nr:N-acetyltransferase [Mycobacteroides abscessus]MDO3128020.1 N-acetyltransferase [Mycobacteroides abscessus subsp. bolletii]SPX79769.1 DNA binding transcriptional regulator [Mycobacteroides abscessus]
MTWELSVLDRGLIESPTRQRQRRSPVSVRRVESHRDAKQFIAMPWHIYGGDPRWRPTLRRVMQAKMNSKHNPLHGEVQVENFVAYRGGSPVGRISAAIDSAYVQRYGECAFFGFFESEDDESIAGALLGEAERWAARRGVTKMVGPFSYTSREEVGLLVSGYDRPPALMQPYNPRYYPALVEASGYRKKFDTASYRWHLDGSQDVRQRLVRRADAVMRDQGVTVRSVRMRHYTEELEVLRGLYNDSFAHHPENVPLSREVFSGMAAEMRPLIDPNIVRIVESEGTPVGFLLMLPDVNEIAGRSGRLTPALLTRLAARRDGRIRGIDTAVVVLIGAVQTQFGAGIGRVLAGEIVRTITGSGYSSVATTWVHEDNVWSNSLTAQMKTDPEKIHRVYQKAL